MKELITLELLAAQNKWVMVVLVVTVTQLELVLSNQVAVSNLTCFLTFGLQS